MRSTSYAPLSAARRRARTAACLRIPKALRWTSRCLSLVPPTRSARGLPPLRAPPTSWPWKARGAPARSCEEGLRCFRPLSRHGSSPQAHASALVRSAARAASPRGARARHAAGLREEICRPALATRPVRRHPAEHRQDRVLRSPKPSPGSAVTAKSIFESDQDRLVAVSVAIEPDIWGSWTSAVVR